MQTVSELYNYVNSARCDTPSADRDKLHMGSSYVALAGGEDECVLMVSLGRHTDEYLRTGGQPALIQYMRSVIHGNPE